MIGNRDQYHSQRVAQNRTVLQPKNFHAVEDGREKHFGKLSCQQKRSRKLFAWRVEVVLQINGSELLKPKMIR
jgi:hypothetical protein